MSMAKSVVALLILFLLVPGVVLAERDTITLTFWHIWDEWRTELMTEVINRFEEQYPWIQVEQEVMHWSGRRDRTISAYAGGVPPDLLMTQRWEVPWFASQRMIAPIDRFMEERDISVDILFPGELGGFWYEGELYSFPMPGGAATTYIGVYNKDLVAAAGLPDQFPETWSDYNYATRLLNRWDGEGNLVQIAGHAGHGGLFRPLLYSNASQYICDDERTITLDTPEAVQVLEWQRDNRDLYQGHLIGGAGDFYAGQQALIFHNQSIFGHLLQTAPDINYGAGRMPYNQDNPDASGHGVIDAGWGYVIPNTAPLEVQHAAYLLMEWVTIAEQGGVWFLKQQGRPSAVIEYVVGDPDFYDINQDWDGVIEVMMADLPIPITPVDPEIRGVINRMYGWIFNDGMPIRGALIDAQRQAQVLLDDYYGIGGR